MSSDFILKKSWQLIGISEIKLVPISSAAARTKGRASAAADLALGRSPSKHTVSRNQDPKEIYAIYYYNSVSSAALSWW